MSKKNSSWLFIVIMNLWVYSLTILLTLIGMILPFLLFGLWFVVTWWPKQKIMHHLIWIYGRAWFLIIRPFITFQSDSFDQNDICFPCILVINHLSFLDTYFVSKLPFFDITITIRNWPFKMFWYALFMRIAGYLNLEQQTWEESLEAAKRELDAGRSILFFPEGHRSRDGQLGRFYSGAFKVATKTGVPLVPLCITGTDVLLPAGRRWLRPADIRMRMLSPVDPADFPGPLGHVELRKHVKAAMAASIEEMCANREEESYLTQC